MAEQVLDPALRELGYIAHGHRQVTVSSSKDDDATHIGIFQGRPGSPGIASDIQDISRDYDIAVERAQTWTGVARFGFNALLASPVYKNKLRLKPDRKERIIYFLTVHDAKSREKDRTDAQAKYQAHRWMYENGFLYRKESRLQQPRRHLDASEVFDVLTAEHLISGHHGRDKMLKVLETKYIGYTKEELMYVLDHCLECSSKYIRGAAAKRRETGQGNDLNNGDAESGLSEMTSTNVSPVPRRSMDY